MGNDFRVGSISAAIKLDTSDWARGIASVKRSSANMNATTKGLAAGFAGVAASAGLAVGAIGGLGGAMLSAKRSLHVAIEYESAFTGVRKTVNATALEFERIADQFSRMGRELPMAQTELLGLAEAGGQLGIQTENLAEFAETMAKVGITTNLSADSAATTFARWANITGLAQSEFDNLASTLVGLGNNFATTEAEIADMGSRLAGVGKQVGLTDSDILAMATGLSSVGLNAEMAGTAMSRMLADIASELANGGRNVQLFATLAGESVDAFQKSFREDALGSVLDMLEGLQRFSDSGGNAFGVLEQLGFNDARMRDAILRTAGAADTFREAQVMASNAFESTAALDSEAATRFEDTAMQIQLTKNAFSELAKTIGDEMLPGFRSVLSFGRDVALEINGNLQAFKWINSFKTNRSASSGDPEKPISVEALNWVLDGTPDPIEDFAARVEKVKTDFSGATDIIRNLGKNIAEAAISQDDFRISVEESLKASQEELKTKGALLDIDLRRSAAADMRLELFPREAMAEQLKNVTDFANEFPAIIDNEAISRALKNIWEEFRELGITTTEDLSTYLERLPLKAQQEFESIRARAADAEFGLANIEPLDFSQQALGQNILGGLSTPDNIADKINESILAVQKFKGVTALTFNESNALVERFWFDFTALSEDGIKEAIANIRDPKFRKAFDETFKNMKDAQDKGVWAAMGTAERWDALGGAVAQVGSQFGNSAKEAQAAGQIMSAVASAVTGDWVGVAMNIANVFDIFDDGEKELSGFEKAIDDIKAASDEWIDDLTDNFVEFTKTGRFEWNNLVQTMLDDMNRALFRELIAVPIRDFGKGLLGFAKGGVFDGGKLIPAAKGHVTTSPEFFRFNSGELGLRGEAGSEAVLPLKRDRNGILGVNASGGGKVNVTINNNTPARVDVREAPGSGDIEIIIEDAIEHGIEKYFNSGRADASMILNYGLTRGR